MCDTFSITDSSIDKIINAEKIEKVIINKLNILQSDTTTNNVTASEQEKHFLCGDRLNYIIELIGITKSKVVELTSFDSEKRLNDILNNEQECKLSEVKEFATLTGVSQNWLIHGEGGIFEYDCISYYEDISDFIPKRYENVYKCLNIQTFKIYIIFRISKYHYYTLTTNYSIDFFDWSDDHNKIPRVYKHLRSINKATYNYSCCLFFDKNIKFSLAENFMGRILETLRPSTNNWLEDLLDLNDISYSHNKNYDWFLKIRNYFLEYRHEL